MRLYPTNKPNYVPVRGNGMVKLDRERGNVWEWFCFYASKDVLLANAAKEHPRVSKSYMNESVTPWRHGRGVALRVGSNLLSLGAWKKGNTPIAEPHDLAGNVLTLESIEAAFNSAAD